MFEQHGAVTVSRCQIASEQCDWTRSLAEHTGERKGVADGTGFNEIAFNHVQRLVRESLQPHDPRLKVMRRDPLVELEAKYWRIRAGYLRTAKHELDVTPRVALITQI